MTGPGGPSPRPDSRRLQRREDGPGTIVLVHGFWVTSRSWEHWKARYESLGYTVHTPAYPGFEVEVEGLRADPTPVRQLTIRAVVDHLSAFLDGLQPGSAGSGSSRPVLIGHSAGGCFVQVLLDRGYGCAGVALNSAPPEGVRTTPPSQLRSVLPVVRNPLNRRAAIGLTRQQWRYAFANTYPQGHSDALYDRYHVPASRRVLLDSVLANYLPGRQDAWVDYGNTSRAPLLLLSGGEDHLMPPVVQADTLARYHGHGTVTEQEVLDGRPHLMGAGPGWEEVADRSLEWALEHAGWRTPTSATTASTPPAGR
ncbi:alpha/beta hydrolase [Aquipuribacter sp. SD81]|uniref:alpha/beta hydrolase n=1 Tax=Aquipuribacter sp. SD81 TaxID=3127703 RepID=UPI003018CFE4